MYTILLRTIQTNLKKLAAYFGINAMFILLLAAMFPSIQDEAEDLNKLIESYPEELLKVFGFNETTNFFDNFAAFIGGEHFSFVWPILIIIFVVSYSSHTIAGEIEKGTIDLLLVQPISRIRLYFAKFFAGLDLIAIFVIITVLAVWPIAKFFGVGIDFINLLVLAVGGFLFGFAILGLNFLFSSFSSTSARASTMTVGVVVVMYALNLLATLNVDYEAAQYFSFFYYFDYNKLLLQKDLVLETVIVLLGSGVLTAGAGAYLFDRRDISV